MKRIREFKQHRDMSRLERARDAFLFLFVLLFVAQLIIGALTGPWIELF